MYIFSFRSFIQRAPPRPKSFHASSSSSAEASSIASHIASVTTRARSHRDASIFRVHSFARSRRRRFVAPFPSSASSTGASISALNCTSATRRDDTTHHRQSASARSTPSSRDRPRVSRRIKITLNPSRDSSVTNEIERAHRRRAIARSPTPRPRRRRRANRRARPSRPWPSTSADEHAPRANAPPPLTHILDLIRKAHCGVLELVAVNGPSTTITTPFRRVPCLL